VILSSAAKQVIEPDFNFEVPSLEQELLSEYYDMIEM
jgi:hypothetical protein